MEIIYVSLIPRQSDGGVQSSHEAEVVDALWAHCLPGDGLQHVSARAEPGRVDLLIYLLTPDSPGVPSALQRAHTLIARSHRTSPRLNRRYLSPEPLTACEGITTA
ncbi:hypothetical protein [Streptomyces sp. CBMA123]|uniref:hypothetical protein n=1 Tax=Streptomyces sp. CBMA123 TaxID=1896313 RepID=UPI001661E684|nr:hypothetical protein [Streptomyces sp. CBMA123]MBD0695843.1 hypothetical protein [Streptomyces sp. CBMA123]